MEEGEEGEDVEEEQFSRRASEERRLERAHLLAGNEIDAFLIGRVSSRKAVASDEWRVVRRRTLREGEAISRAGTLRVNTPRSSRGRQLPTLAFWIAHLASAECHDEYRIAIAPGAKIRRES